MYFLHCKFANTTQHRGTLSVLTLLHFVVQYAKSTSMTYHVLSTTQTSCLMLVIAQKLSPCVARDHWA